VTSLPAQFALSASSQRTNHFLSPRILSAALYAFSIALLMFLFAPTPAHAQTGSQYGWGPAQNEAGTACWLDSNNDVRCATPQDACESLAIFYSLGGPVNYAYVFPSQEPVQTLQGQWVPGLSCANLYTGNFVAGQYVIFPTGPTPDSNSPTGLSATGTGTVQPFKQVGGGSCGGSDDQGDPDDNTPNGSATSDASGAESATPGCADTSTGNPLLPRAHSGRGGIRVMTGLSGFGRQRR
jgi:hypothetical protein